MTGRWHHGVPADLTLDALAEQVAEDAHLRSIIATGGPLPYHFGKRMAEHNLRLPSIIERAIELVELEKMAHA